MFHNILVCVDSSVHAQRALDEAVDLAEAGNGRLTILTAIPRPPYWAATTVTAAAVEPLAGDLRREAQTALKDAVARVPDSIPVTTVLSEKPIREAIVERLKTGAYDLVVTGSRGRGALGASVLGSVSHFALNHARVPVLIVHADSGPEAAAPDAGADRESEADPVSDRTAAVPA